jgi:hypothetical protein
MKAHALLAAALLSFAAAASAVPIDAVGDTFRVDFDGNVREQPTPGLTASATFLVTEFDADAGRVVLEITLTNTTEPELFGDSRVSALGFDIDADVDAILISATSSGLFDAAVLGGKFPNQFGPIDVCAIGNPENCSGGRNAGGHLGETGVFTLVLNFEGPIGALDLTNCGVRYQAIEPVCGVAADSGTGHGTVPEPRVLGLLGAAGLALLGRRRRA